MQMTKGEKMQPASQPELLAQSAYPQTQLASVTVGEINSDVEKKNNTNHKKIFGIIGVSVGSVALLTLIGLFTLSKGFSASLAKKLKHVSRALQKKIYELSADTKELTTSQKMKLRISKAMQPMADAMQASSNITSIKDSWINHWLKKMKLEPVIKKMNNVFKEIISKNTRNYYIKAETSNLKFCAYLDELAVEAQKAGKPELKAQLENYARELRALYKNTFTSAEHFERTNNAFASMEGLDKQVYDKLFADNGLFKNLKKYKTYITTDLIEKDRTKLAENLLTRKAGLSNNINDNYNNIRRLLNDIKINVNPKDEKAVELVKKTLSHAHKIEVECETIAEVKEALACGADIIMLDNMPVDKMRECVKLIDKKAIVEASGNVKLDTVNEIASTGVDVISTSAIVANAKVLDLGLDI